MPQGFRLIDEKYVPEVDSTCSRYVHEKTGARIMSVTNLDENKVFGISFRTPPADSTGVAHILEHSVLCGSRKYPVKEPFVELLKGSLQTFLNAMTFPDKTCYPVASQNEADFHNLIDVYLDAVFFPRITRSIFEQEGWHLELDDPEDPLSFKGVVYNEMKGAYSSPDSLLAEFSQHSLFPESPYGLDSGGDPAVIPDLTYEQFLEFHRRYYHPSNAWIWFSGDDDVETRFAILREYLDRFDSLQIDSSVPLQPGLPGPVEVKKSYAVTAGTEDPKAMVTVNWLLGEPESSSRDLELLILDQMLIGMSGSPLRKALIDSGLGEDLAGYGLDNELRQSFFSTGLKGIRPEDEKKVETLVLSTLKEVAETGFSPETVEAGINSVEFGLRENNTGSFPRGLNVMLRALRTWLHDGDPFTGMVFDEDLAGIKERVAHGEPVFEELVRVLFLDNSHRSRVCLVPDFEYDSRLEREERERLDVIAGNLTRADREEVVAATSKLRELQEAPDSPEALASLPMLTREDLDPEVKRVPRLEESEKGVPLLVHEQPTAGIMYLDLGFDLRVLDQELLPYVPLLARGVLEMGNPNEDFAAFSLRINRKTGGIYPTLLCSSGEKKGTFESRLFFRAKATMDHAGDLGEILSTAMLRTELDDPARFRQILLEEKASLEHALVPNGHRFVGLRLRARHSLAEYAQEVMGGITFYEFLCDLADGFEEKWPAILERLQEVRKEVVRRKGLVANLTVGREHAETARKVVRELLSGLPGGGGERREWMLPRDGGNEGLTIPAQVNYVGRCLDLRAGGYVFDGADLAVARYLRSTWLWDQVRVLGGAYGGFCSLDRLTSLFCFGSYRDPNIARTLDVYDGAAAFLAGADLSDAEVTKAVIGAVGDMDQHQLPDAKGYSSMLRWLLGISDERRQEIRDRILATRKEDFTRFSEVLASAAGAGSIVVMGAEEGISRAMSEGVILERVRKVL
jgi:hypothetical protein